MTVSYVSTDNGCVMVEKIVLMEMMKVSKIAKIKRAETINSSVTIWNVFRAIWCAREKQNVKIIATKLIVVSVTAAVLPVASHILLLITRNMKFIWFCYSNANQKMRSIHRIRLRR